MLLASFQLKVYEAVLLCHKQNSISHNLLLGPLCNILSHFLSPTPWKLGTQPSFPFKLLPVSWTPQVYFSILPLFRLPPMPQDYSFLGSFSLVEFIHCDNSPSLYLYVTFLFWDFYQILPE